MESCRRCLHQLPTTTRSRNTPTLQPHRQRRRRGAFDLPVLDPALRDNRRLQSPELKPYERELLRRGDNGGMLEPVRGESIIELLERPRQ